jgi:hypothetical protein
MILNIPSVTLMFEFQTLMMREELRRIEMDGACSADEGGKRRVQGFGGET